MAIKKRKWLKHKLNWISKNSLVSVDGDILVCRLLLLASSHSSNYVWHLLSAVKSFKSTLDERRTCVVYHKGEISKRIMSALVQQRKQLQSLKTTFGETILHPI